MKQFLLLITLFLISHCAFTQNSTPVYDSVLAKKLGADKYGMKKYVIAFLKRGKTVITDTVKLQQIQMAHLVNIIKLAADGKLVLAGPFLDQQELEGLFIFNVSTVEEARKFTETDPAIQAGILEMELYPWYGSAAVMQVVPIHNTIQEKSVVE